MITLYIMIILYNKWLFLEIKVGLFGLLIILWKYHSWTEMFQTEQQKKEKARNNNKQDNIYASYQAAEMGFFEYYEYYLFFSYFRCFGCLDLNLAHAWSYRLFESRLVNGWFEVGLLGDVKLFASS